MSSISSTPGASPAVQLGFQQLKLQQAKRNAEQAQATAESLQAQAADAARSAQRAQENARDLSARSDQAQANAGLARQGLAAIRTASQSSAALKEAYSKIATGQASKGTVPVEQAATVSNSKATSTTGKAGATPSPAVNAQGQTTGTVVNTTA